MKVPRHKIIDVVTYLNHSPIYNLLRLYMRIIPPRMVLSVSICLTFSQALKTLIHIGSAYVSSPRLKVAANEELSFLSRFLHIGTVSDPNSLKAGLFALLPESFECQAFDM